MNLFNFFKKNVTTDKSNNNDIQKKETFNFYRWQKIRNYLFVIFLFIGLSYVLMTITIYKLIDTRDNSHKYIDDTSN